MTLLSAGIADSIITPGKTLTYYDGRRKCHGIQSSRGSVRSMWSVTWNQGWVTRDCGGCWVRAQRLTVRELSYPAFSPSAFRYKYPGCGMMSNSAGRSLSSKLAPPAPFFLAQSCPWLSLASDLTRRRLWGRWTLPFFSSCSLSCLLLQECCPWM